MNTTRAVLLAAVGVVLGLFAGCGREGTGLELEQSLREQRQGVCESDAQCGFLSCQAYESPTCVASSDPQAYATCQCVYQPAGGGCQPPVPPCGQGQTFDRDNCMCVDSPPPYCQVVSCSNGKYFELSSCQCVCPDVVCEPGKSYDLNTCTCEFDDPGCMAPRQWLRGTSTCVCPAGSPDPASCQWYEPYNPDTCTCGG